MMQLYNEWLHQMVLLRDALLPFTNWQDVPLLITPTGLRHTEPARDAFLTELLVRQIRHTSIVAFARNVVTGASGPVGYGFEASGGTALPAVLDQPSLTAPRHLLTWRPAPAVGEAATYVPEVQDYYAAPRTLVEDLPPATPHPARSPPVPSPRRSPTGPAPPASRSPTTAPPPTSTSAKPCAATASLSVRTPPQATHPAPPLGPRCAPGLVWTQSSDVTLDATGQDDLVVLALLGRLYPENVTLRPVGRSAARTTADGTGPSRLVTLVDPAQAH